MPFVGEYLDQATDKEFRLFGWVLGLLAPIFTNFVVQYILHFRLTEEVKGFRSVEISAVIDEPNTYLMTTSKPIFFVADLRVGFV